MNVSTTGLSITMISGPAGSVARSGTSQRPEASKTGGEVLVLQQSKKQLSLRNKLEMRCGLRVRRCTMIGKCPQVSWYGRDTREVSKVIMAGDKNKQKGKAEHFPLKWKRDFRIGSPQRVFRAVGDSVEDLGYTAAELKGLDEETGGLCLKESPISDTATFRGEVRSEKVLSTGHDKGYITAGIVLVVLGVVLGFSCVATGNIALGAGAVVLLILGIVFLAVASRVSKAFLLATVEGEAYKATAKMAERGQELDVVADVRLTIQGRIGVFRGGTEMGQETPRDLDLKIVKADFSEMCERVEAVLPSFMMQRGKLGGDCSDSKGFHPD